MVRIEVDSEKAKGKGLLEYTFVADHFGPPPDCHPARKPTFKLDDIQQKPKKTQPTKQ